MIEGTTDRVVAPGNGSTTVFPYSFWINDADDLNVILVGTNGVKTLQTRVTHYTVSGAGGANGGTVTMLTAPPSNTFLVIERARPLLQEADFRNNAGVFTPESIETALDKLQADIQRLERLILGEIPIERTYTTATLPTAAKEYEDWIVKVRDATGPTYIKICVESATANTWAWKDLAVGNLF